jgi:quinol---cytochrome c reductase iron-sulfur subunit, bacillus type
MKTGDLETSSNDGTQRRSFLVRFAAVVCGGIVALFPFAAGLGVVIDPWRRSRRSASANGDAAAGGVSTAKFIPICSLAALPADGMPRAFPVISDVVDGWTHSANQRIGMIFLERTDAGDKSSVVAFNAECPHLGCFVDYNSADGHFECPCHKSAFDKDGAKLYGPSRRGLDSLNVKLEKSGDQTEVLVAFEKFQKGIEERKPAE